jgi:hypothetical protein
MLKNITKLGNNNTKNGKKNHPHAEHHQAWKQHLQEWKENHPHVEHPQAWKQQHQEWKENHGKGKCQFKKFFRDGMNLMEETKYTAARDIFLEQLKEAKSEWQQRIPCYYIACCEALLGNLDLALEFLEKAVNFGFRNLCKFREDPALNSLRSSEKYQQLLKIVAERKEVKCDEFRAELRKKIPQECKNREPNSESFAYRKCHWKKFANNCPGFEKPQEKTEVAPVCIISEKVDVPHSVELLVEKAPVPHKYEKTLATLEEMGFLNRDQNIEALNKVDGDAKLAVSVLLKYS